jgi:hypothetical protein
MKPRHLSGIALACAIVFSMPVADAQQRRAAPAAQPTRQAPPPGVSTFGLPNPAGLASPVPAGLTSPNPPSLTPPGVPNLSSPGTAPGSPAIDAGIAAPTTTGGGAGVVFLQQTQAGANVMGGPPAPSGPYSAVDIARAFLEADTNHDGDLSRAEAQRIALPVPFDDLDRNRDGLLSRFEYEDAFR